MLDRPLRELIDPTLNAIGSRLAGAGIKADHVTVAGLVTGLAAAGAIAFHFFWLGLALILLSRLCDGLDGAVARHSQTSDFGGYLDIVLDFAFYSVIPVSFVLADPGANGLAGAVLVLSFYVNGATFLTYAIMAERRGLGDPSENNKSIFFTTGLAEASETLAVFILMCLFPAWFPVLAWIFAVICFYTAVSRIMLAARTLR